MNYISTRDKARRVTAAEAVVAGISPEGGLYVPETIPTLDYKSLYEMDYSERAQTVLQLFFDFDITGVAEKAYADFDGDPAPLVKLSDKTSILELWHGKTCAFKDMALSVLPLILERAKAHLGKKEKTLILVATSGDTGKAALEGFKDANGVETLVFYPQDGVSSVQQRAMQAQEGNNCSVAAIAGNFDDAQTAVKAAFADMTLAKELKAAGYELSSANSINIGRLVPQIAYYFSAYCDAVNGGCIDEDAPLDFCVPTGNFGNILAGYYAKLMGLPIGRLICASNKNDVLTDFFRTATYDINREFYKTDSPSMDILISSNFERFLFESCGRNDVLTRERMQLLKTDKRYSVTEKELEAIHETFVGACCNDEEGRETIGKVFDDSGYLLDPHTAVAYNCAEAVNMIRHTVIVSTANPYKFVTSVLPSLGLKLTGDTEKDFVRLEDHTAMPIPDPLMHALKAPIRFTDVIDRTEIIDYIAKNYGKQNGK